MLGQELTMRSPVPPVGASVWHLAAQRMLTPSAARTQLLDVFRQRVAVVSIV